jgi:hypothetical protein
MENFTNKKYTQFLQNVKAQMITNRNHFCIAPQGFYSLYLEKHFLAWKILCQMKGDLPHTESASICAKNLDKLYAGGWAFSNSGAYATRLRPSNSRRPYGGACLPGYIVSLKPIEHKPPY